MSRIAILVFLTLLLAGPVFAREAADNISVELGIISWGDIQRELKEKPATHAEEYHLKMARKMVEMPGGGFEGADHILVVLKDRISGRQIGDAEVEVTARTKTGMQEMTHKLVSMTMDGIAGYGEYFRLSPDTPYVFDVRFSLKGGKKIHTVRIEKTLPPGRRLKD